MTCGFLKRRHDDNYVQNYYDPELQIKNHGYMTLVSSHYFPWGVAVMRFFAEHANRVQQGCCGDQFAMTVQAAIEADSQMFSKFLECAKDFVALSDDQKLSVHARLVEKIKNTKISDVVTVERERLTGRRSNNVQDVALRQSLRAKSGGKGRKKSS
jgi:PDZ domain-containing secreted protein